MGGHRPGRGDPRASEGYTVHPFGDLGRASPGGGFPLLSTEAKNGHPDVGHPPENCVFPQRISLVVRVAGQGHGPLLR
jgi:hypothetical protein